MTIDKTPERISDSAAFPLASSKSTPAKAELAPLSSVAEVQKSASSKVPAQLPRVSFLGANRRAAPQASPPRAASTVEASPKHLPKPATATSKSLNKKWGVEEADSLLDTITALRKSDTLYKEIGMRRGEIREVKEQWKNTGQAMQSAQDKMFIARFRGAHKSGSMQLCDGSAGGVYFLHDSGNKPRYVLKGYDQDTFCLNNPQRNASPCSNQDESIRVRQGISTYGGVFREAATVAIAEKLSLSHVIPRGALAIVTDDSFHDILDAVSEAGDEQVLNVAGHPDRETLCFVQEFLSDSTSLQESIGRKQHETITGESVEKCNILCWITGEQDGHAHNFLVVNRGDTKELRKIDNGLTFGSQHAPIDNVAARVLPQSLLPLSDAGKKIIHDMSIDTICESLVTAGMDSRCIQTTRERLQALKSLAAIEPPISQKEIDEALCILNMTK